MSRRRREQDGDDGPSMQFDVATVLLVAIVVVIVLYLTWEIWAGHPFAE